MLRQLFGFPMQESKEDKVLIRPTILLVPEEGTDGSVTMVHKVLEPLVSGPLVGLSYDDFSISSLLAAGCDLKDIQLPSDGRLGFDKEIDALSEKFADASDKFFKPVNE